MGCGGQSDEMREEARLLRQARLRKVLWRDFAFLVLGGVALKIVNYVESHASDADLRGADVAALHDKDASGVGIVDAGFVLTAPLHRFLSERRDWNDALALINSLVLIVPNAYLAKVTLWHGDYTLSFRLLATQLFRSLCGWFTYLPPDGDFLVSYYDFPEILQCLSRDCSLSSSSSGDPRRGGGWREGEEILPFVSFFSGHVATVVMVANHMYIHGHVRSAVAMHVLNVLQIVRLLATRGHYSIDIIVGWCVAVYVSNPAARLGWYYSRGMTWRELMMPGGAADAFERITGARDAKIGRRGSRWRSCADDGGREEAGAGRSDDDGGSGRRRRREEEEDDDAVTSDTAARILAETASEFAARSIVDLRAELSRLGLRMQDLIELRRAEMVRLLDLAQLRTRELRAEARWFGVTDREARTMSRGEVLEVIMERIKGSADRTARIAAGMAHELAMRSLSDLRAELTRRAGGLGLRQVHEMRELRRNDLLRLLALAQLKVEELRAEARLLGVTLTEGMGRRDILMKIMARMRDVVLRSLSANSFSEPEEEEETSSDQKKEMSTAAMVVEPTAAGTARTLTKDKKV